MLFVLLAIIFQVSALILAKLAGIQYSGIQMYLNIYYALSIVSLGAQALVWQQALKKYNLSDIYPFMSIVLVFIPLLSILIFNEEIKKIQFAGIALIVIGTVIVGKSKTSE